MICFGKAGHDSNRLDCSRLMINLSPPSIKFSKTHNTPQKPQNQWWNMHIVNYPPDIRQIQFQGIKNLAKSSSFWLAQPAQTTNISLSDDDSK